MDNLLFSNSFNFNHFDLKSPHNSDSRGGSAYHYIGFLHKGSVRLSHKDGVLELKAGDCFYIPLRFSYRSYWQGEKNIVFESFGFTYFPNKDNLHYALQKIDAPNAWEILKKVDSRQNHSCENIALFYSSLSKLLKYMKTENRDKREEIISKATEYIDKNINCTAKDIARHCGISESGLYNTFKTARKITPNALKQQIQVEKSLNLLCSTDLKIEEIAEKCGFCSAIYFRRVFKKITGKLPNQMRKMVTP